MKITLNLSPAASTRDRYALSWALPATVVGLAVLILLCRSSVQEYRGYLENRNNLAGLQKRAEDLKSQEATIRSKLGQPAFHDVIGRAKFVNNLIDQRELSVTELTARIAGLLPESAHLTGLALSSPKKPGDDYMVRMGITAKGEDAVETFINDLEDSPDFQDVSIINQGFQEESSQGQQVSLICTARYLPGADITTEKPSAEEPTTNHKPNR